MTNILLFQFVLFDLRHLVELELSAGFLAIGGILSDDTFFHGLIETGNKFLELLLGYFLIIYIGSLEKLLVRIARIAFKIY